MTFFTLYFLHIILFEIAAWAVVNYWGIGWVPYILAAMLLATGQVCSVINNGYVFMWSWLLVICRLRLDGCSMISAICQCSRARG